MLVYVCYSVDQFFTQYESSLASNDREGLARTNQDLQHACNLLRSWAMSAGGSPVVDHPAMGVLEVPAEKMTQLPDLRRQFEQTCSMTLSIGLGMELHEADVALKVADQRGGDQITLYTAEMQQELAPSPAQPGMLQLIKAEGTPPPSPAQETQKEEAAPKDPKSAIAQALQELKANAQAIEQLKSTNPEAFTAVMNTVQAMILMGQGMVDDEATEGPGAPNPTAPTAK